ncbi:MAG: cytochrome C oxidase subunit IV family protein [Gemmatimonadetes bacterium]|nr:cytochrome C oxidase subunit IV family protein [Gemmatimonadota bacterium]
MQYAAEATKTAAVPRLFLWGFGTAGLVLGVIDGYLLQETLAAAAAGGIMGALLAVGGVLLASKPRPQDLLPAEPPHKAQPNYLLIWAVLFVLTVVEIFVAFAGLPRTYVLLALVLLAIWKALLVALYYMHLRFEPRRLWILAAAPLPLAVILVIAVIQEF